MRGAARIGWFGAALLFIALLLLPGPPRSAFPGAPLSNPGYLLLAGGVWLLGLGLVWPPARRVPPALLAVLAVLVVLKPLAAGIAGPIGWRGEYYADADPAARRSFKSGVLTRDHRVDAAIDFDGPRLGLHFVNDPIRYRYPYSLEPRDRKFPVAVDWSGYLWLEEAASVRIEASARGHISV
ncbi:MAG: hypothetical protein H6Q10_3337, partial [Acidobacteria bacterium]|nr:hypothetical protein [Acidobacteriota bacterium]